MSNFPSLGPQSHHNSSPNLHDIMHSPFQPLANSNSTNAINSINANVGTNAINPFAGMNVQNTGMAVQNNNNTGDIFSTQTMNNNNAMNNNAMNNNAMNNNAMDVFSTQNTNVDLFVTQNNMNNNNVMNNNNNIDIFSTTNTDIPQQQNNNFLADQMGNNNNVAGGDIFSVQMNANANTADTFAPTGANPFGGVSSGNPPSTGSALNPFQTAQTPKPSINELRGTPAGVWGAQPPGLQASQNDPFLI